MSNSVSERRGLLCCAHNLHHHLQVNCVCLLVRTAVDFNFMVSSYFHQMLYSHHTLSNGHAGQVTSRACKSVTRSCTVCILCHTWPTEGELFFYGKPRRKRCMEHSSAAGNTTSTCTADAPNEPNDIDAVETLVQFSTSSTLAGATNATGYRQVYSQVLQSTSPVWGFAHNALNISL